MPRRRSIALYAVLPFALLLSACDGKMEPGFSKTIDVSNHLERFGTSWQAQPEKRAELKVGDLAQAVAVRWIPVTSGAHRGISRITVDFPEHRKGDQFDAAVLGPPINMGTTEALLEALTLSVEWTRTAGGRAQLATAQIVLKGDGTSSDLR